MWGLSIQNVFVVYDERKVWCVFLSLDPKRVVVYEYARAKTNSRLHVQVTRRSPAQSCAFRAGTAQGPILQLSEHNKRT